MKILKRIIVSILITALEFGSFPAAAIAQATTQPTADVEKEQFSSLVTETKPSESLTFTGVGHGVNSIIPAMADMQASNISAGFESSAKVHKLAKEDFRPNEEIDVVIENGAHKDYKTELIDAIGNKVALETSEVENGAAKVITVEQPSSFRPGKYTLRISDNRGGVSEQDFSWGVLAVNPDKSVYTPNEIANLAIGVLNEGGDMVCDAQVELQITDPHGSMTSLSTDNGKIIVNEECKSHDFTLKPDYETRYETSSVGKYKMILKSQTMNGTHSIADSFEVRETVPFDVKRISATRIYPPNTYPVTLEITANQDFEGTVSETVPGNFKIARPGEEVKTDSEKVDSIIAADVEASQSAGILAPDSLPKKSPVFQTDAILSYQTINTVGDYDGGKAVLGASIPGIGMPFSGNYPVTQEFGQSLVYDEYGHGIYDSFGMHGHDGMDFAMPEGTPILAVDSGKVLLAGTGDYGITVVIEHTWGRSYYGHLSSVEVKEGDEIPSGTQIARSGNTGLSTGPHLHFGIKPHTNESENGYYGKVDPAYYIGMKQSATAVLGASTKFDDSINAAPSTDVQILNWRISVKKGDTIKIGYNYLAPRISPQFYTLGPAVFTDRTGKDIFHEERKWQIASDALDYKFKRGTFTVTPSTTCAEPCFQTISGVGFKPKAIIFEWSEQAAENFTNDQYVGMGFATSPDQERAVSYWSQDAQGTSDTGKIHSSTKSIVIQNANGGIPAQAELVSFDSDGFTLNWINNNPIAYIVHYTAIGGSDVSNAKVGSFTLSSSGATQSFTDPGFQPDFMMFLSNGTEATDVNSPHASISAGFSAGPTKEAGMVMVSEDARGPAQDSWRQQSTSSSILLLTGDTGAQNAIADVASFDTSGFTLNVTDTPVVNTPIYYLAIQGGQYDVGAFAQPTSTGTQSVYTGFRPSGIMTLAASQSASTAIANTATLSTGGASRDTGGVPWCNDTSGINCTSPGIQLNAANDWCNDTTGITCTNSWSTRKKITFNNASASANLTEFPVLVKLDSTRINYAKTQNSGQDIRFVDPSNPNQALSHEIESWNESGSSYVWVKVPQLDASSSADFIWMYYGNSGASDGQDTSNVWDSNYNIVYHMSGTNGSASLPDSAGTAQNATKLSGTGAGEPTNTTNEKLDGVQDFDGSNDYTSTATPGLPTTDFTFEAFVAVNGTSETVFAVSDGSGGDEFRIRKDSGNTFEMMTNGSTRFNTTSTIANNTWNHVVLTRSTSTLRGYVNGVQEGSGTDATAFNFTSSLCALLLGADNNTSGCTDSLSNQLDGFIDEVRISSIARSSSWLRATFLTENDQFNIYGTEQLYSELQSTSGWSARKKITFNNSTSMEDFENFPVLVTLTAGRIDYNKTQNSGQDIRFVDPNDPKTVLPHEIDTWNESGTSYVWVKVPKINKQSNTDHIWMYYGNPSASDGQDAVNVWDSSYKGVWHTKETSGTTVSDSTANLNTGALLNGAAVTSGGKIGYANVYDGTNDIMKASASASLNNLHTQNGIGGGMTVSAWIKADTSANSTWGEIAMKAQNASPSNGWLFETIGTNNLISLNQTYSTTNLNRDSAAAFTDTVWTHVTLTASASANANWVRLYSNGTELSYGATIDGEGTASDDSAHPFTSACDQVATSPNCFDGTIDELRVSNTARSPYWVKAEYQTMNDTMNIFGSEEIYGSGAFSYSQGSLWSDDLDNETTSNTNTNSDTTKIIRFAASPTGGGTPRTLATAQLESFDPTGFTLNWTEADSASRLVLYWAVGSVTASQEDYRWYKNANAVTPTAALEDENSSTILPKNKPYARLRANISTGGNGMNASTQGFKLQYAANQAEAAIGGTTDWCNDTTGITCTAPLQPGDEVPASTTSDWCNDTSGVTCTTDWSSRRKITFNNASASAALTDFPVMIKLDSTRINYSKTQNSGQDIRFVDPADPNTALPHEIEVWNESGESVVWVKVPSISAQSNTDSIWMYYGNDSVSDGQAASSVWDGNYNIVYHMDEAAGNLSDSAGSAQDAARGGATVSQATGKVGYGQDFSGTGYTSTSNPSLPTGNFTYEMWLNSDLVDDDTIFMSSDGAAGAASEIRIYLSTTDVEVTVDSTGSPLVDRALTASKWYHLTISRSGNRTIYYKNGVPINSVIDADTLNFLLDSDGVTQCELFLGVDVDSNCNGGLSNYLNGRLDEFRVSSTSRDGNWVSASYLNQNDQFNTYGTEVTQAETKLSSTGWQYRKKIQFNNASSSAALTDFPVMVKLDQSRIDYNKTQDDGGDIRFVDPSDTSTVLAHEIESWNENGTSYVWVKVPSLAAGTEDYVWMYYGNASASDGQAATSVWDSNFNAVYHLKEDPSGGAPQMQESTTNNLDMTSSGSMPSSALVTGKVDGSTKFDGSNDYIYASDNAAFEPSTDMTVSFWTYLNQTASAKGEDMVFVYKDNSIAPWYSYQFVNMSSNNTLMVDWINNSSTGFPMYTNSSLEANRWYHITFVKSGAAGKIYLNGAANHTTSPSYTGTIYSSNGEFRLGAVGATQKRVNGIMDETRLSNTARSEDWIEAEFLSTSDQMNMYGEEQPYAISGTAVAGWRDVADSWCSDTSGIVCDTNWGYRKRIAFNNPVNHGPEGFLEGFEDGNLNGWTVTTSPGSTLATDTSIVHSGGYSAKVTMAGDADSDVYAIKNIPNTTSATMEGYVYLTNTGYYDIFGLDTTAFETFGIHSDVSGNICVWNGVTTIDYCSTTAFPLNAWHKYRIEAVVSPTVGELRVYMDDTLIADLDQSGIDTGSNPMNKALFGDGNNGRTATYYIDDMNVKSTSSNLTNFPVLVKLNSSRIDYGKTQNDGDDIRFVDPDDPSVVLDHEIETWNESGESFVWVEVPQIDANSTNDSIWMYYGNESATNGQNGTGTWETNYKAVWHLKEQGNGTNNEFIDSTTNDHAQGGDGTAVKVPVRTTGAMGYGQSFDGSDDIIAGSDTAVFSGSTAYTLELWIKPDDCGDSSGQGNLITKEGLLDWMICYDGPGTNDLGTWMQINSTWTESVDNAVTYNNWQHVVAQYDGTTLTYYVNGNAVTWSTGTITADNAAGVIVIGADGTGSSTTNFDGIMDEIRISDSNRSADWIKAEYLTGSDQMNSFGAEETQSSSIWKYKDNSSVSNGAIIGTSVLGTSATGSQLTYQESNLTTLNPTAIAAGEKREFDFSLDGTLASNRRTYYFRLVNADGTPLTNYTRYPSITVGVPNQKVMRGGKFFNYKASQPFTF